MCKELKKAFKLLMILTDTSIMFMNVEQVTIAAAFITSPCVPAVAV